MINVCKARGEWERMKLNKDNVNVKQMRFSYYEVSDHFSVSRHRWIAEKVQFKSVKQWRAVCSIYPSGLDAWQLYKFSTSFHYLNWRLYFAKCNDMVTVICANTVVQTATATISMRLYMKRWRWWRQWESNTFASYMFHIRVLAHSLNNTQNQLSTYGNFIIKAVTENDFAFRKS